jgi:GH24 family phage-related lysozyme (muramidase)
MEGFALLYGINNKLIRFIVQTDQTGRPTMVPVFFSETSPITSSQQPSFPMLNHLPSGELLVTGGRAVLPQGFVLRPVYSRGLALTKSSEGWVPHLYNDAADYCTIGYGHLIKKSKCDGTEPLEFSRGITKERGEEILSADLASSEYTVMTAVTPRLTDGQFAALTDFVFNVGSANFRNSTLLRAVNATQIDRVSAQFRRWVIAGGKPLHALQLRRDQEVDMFFEGIPKPKNVPKQGEDLSPLDIRTGMPVGIASPAQGTQKLNFKPLQLP